MRSEIEAQGALVVDRSRFADYITLTKPELTFLSVVTAVAGVFLASSESVAIGPLVHVFVGTLLVGSGAGALNQLIERKYDGMMRRTEHRPLPSGRLAPFEALVFGIATSLCGVADLALFANPLAGFLAFATLTTYLFLYTPLKRVTHWATVLGGIPGALPPVIGWAAVRNDLSIGAWLLFAVLFFWQMPHFFSLAWMYRKDYARAGYRMLTVLDPSGGKTSRHIIMYCVCLLVASIVPVWVGMSGSLYLAAAVLLGLGFIGMGIQLWVDRSNENARKLFFASLVYLPVLMLFMVVDRL